MELISIMKEIYETKQRLRNAGKEVYSLGVDKATTERAYRLALSQEMMKLRYEKMPATILSDIARGNVSDLKFQRDLATEKSKAGLAAMNALTVEINALQSIAKYQSDI